MREVGIRVNAETDSNLAAKQQVISDVIGSADVTAKMVVMEQQVANIETKLSTKVLS